MTPGLSKPGPAAAGFKGQNAERANVKAAKAFTLHTWTNLPGKMSLFEQLAKLKRKKNSKSNLTKPASTNNSCGFCVTSPQQPPLPQRNNLRAVTKPHNHQTSEWLNVEKSVRFTLPPDEVKRRTGSQSSKGPKSSRVVTFIPSGPDDDEIEGLSQWPSDSYWPSSHQGHFHQGFHHSSSNLEQGFDNSKRCCWSTQSCRRYSRPLPPIPSQPSLKPLASSATSCHCYCYNKSEEAFLNNFGRNSHYQHQHHRVPDVDYTDDDEIVNPAFLNNTPSYYPSGSMTLPSKSSQEKKKAAENKKKAESSTANSPRSPAVSLKKPAEKAVSSSTELLTSSVTVNVPPLPVSVPSLPAVTPAPTLAVRKTLNESGESDPGYESDSTGSKSKVMLASAVSGSALSNPGLSGKTGNALADGPKATTLPRRSAVVQKTSLDRRKFGENDNSSNSATSSPFTTVEIISPLEHRDVAASQTLRAALSKVEAAHPGFSYDLVLGLVRKADASSLNMNESLLRLQGAVSDQDCIEYRSSRTEEPFQELNKKSVALKRILARIPEEISDRKTFLETIKEIASAIKKLLDAVNEVSAYIPGTSGKQALDQKKREFVKYSKRFSNTLKEFFRDGQPGPVFTSATYLIYQTNQVMITVKDKCE